MKSALWTLTRAGVLFPALGALAVIGVLLARPRPPLPRHSERPVCAPDNGGLTLPKGFCGLIVARNLGSVRHLVVAPNGDIFVNRQSGGVIALRDTSGDGVADVTRPFHTGGGTGIALEGNFLYYSTDDAVYRYPWRAGQLEPEGDAEPIVTDLPSGGDHKSKSIALGPGGALFVNVGSATNSCQQQNRKSQSPGRDPCDELTTRAGIWRFDANRRGQRFSDGQRWATGLRNTVALAAEPGSHELLGVVNGRDQLADNWGFSAEKSAENPGEELVRPAQGDDYGWPYCYYDTDLKQMVLAPEYGGDGKQVGRCAKVKPALMAFPGHWAPMAIAFGSAQQFGSAYASGMFVAFHGSWNRAPLPQAGYRVVWQPMAGGRPTGDYQTFLTGIKGPTSIRPSGLAIGPDGSLYISADENETIWRVLSSSGAERTKEEK
jgi:glucose/arabinose dehydrogenase